MGVCRLPLCYNEAPSKERCFVHNQQEAIASVDLTSRKRIDAAWAQVRPHIASVDWNLMLPEDKKMIEDAVTRHSSSSNTKTKRARRR